MDARCAVAYRESCVMADVIAGQPSESLQTTTPDTAGHTPKRRTRRLMIRSLLFVLSITLVIFIVSQADWAYLVELAAQAPMHYIVAGFAVYLLLNMFRVMRYDALLDSQNSQTFAARGEVLRYRTEHYSISLVHNFMVRLLPFKLGEVFYPALMKRRGRISLMRSSVALLLSRLLELVVIVVVGSISLILFSDDVGVSQSVARVVFTVIVSGLLITGLIFRFAAVDTLLARLSRFTGKRAGEGIQVLWLDARSTVTGSGLRQALLLSIATYGCSFFVNTILLLAMGVELNVGQIIALVSIAMFATAIPLNISGFGSVEVGWSTGLALFIGTAVDRGLAIGFFINGSILLFSLLGMIIGVAGMMLSREAGSSATDSDRNPAS